MSMSIDNLKNNVSDYQRVYWWNIVIPSIVGGGSAEDLEVRAQSTQVPGSGVGRILIPYKGTAGLRIPGKLELTHDWPCTFVEGLDRKVFDAIVGWRQSIVNARTGMGGLDSLIKKNLYLRLTSGQEDITNKIKLVGCYPTAMDDVPLPYDVEAALMFSVTFSYDYWEPDN